MARVGVDRQVVSPWMELTPVGLDPADAATVVTTVNAAMADEVERSRGRLVGMGMAWLGDPERAAAELQVSVVERGLCGAILPASAGGLELGDPAHDPFWAMADRLRCLVLVHPFRSVELQRATALGLHDVVGTPSESALAIGSLVLGGVLERYPALRVVVVHGGGTLPYLAGRFDALAGGRSPATPRPSSSLQRLHFDSLTHSAQVLRWLLEFAGADHVVLGSDYPFPTGAADPVAPVRALPGLSTSGRAAVLGGNAEALLAGIAR